MSIRAVVFDIGGVMIRLAAGWRNACQASGVTHRPFVDTPAYRTGLRTLELEYGCGHISPETYFTRLDRLMQGLYSPDELRALHQAIIQEEFPGIEEVVRHLKEAGYFTACLSNTCASHWELLDDPVQYPAIGLLDARFASQQLGVMKPDPAIYRQFEDITGFQLAEILFFDDVEDNITAARDHEWQAVHITREDSSVPQIREVLAAMGLLPFVR